MGGYHPRLEPASGVIYDSIIGQMKAIIHQISAQFVLDLPRDVDINESNCNYYPVSAAGPVPVSAVNSNNINNINCNQFATTQFHQILPTYDTYNNGQYNGQLNSQQYENQQLQQEINELNHTLQQHIDNDNKMLQMRSILDDRDNMNDNNPIANMKMNSSPQLNSNSNSNNSTPCSSPPQSPRTTPHRIKHDNNILYYTKDNDPNSIDNEYPPSYGWKYNEPIPRPCPNNNVINFGAPPPGITRIPIIPIKRCHLQPRHHMN